MSGALNRHLSLLITLTFTLVLTACVRDAPQIIVITATSPSNVSSTNTNTTTLGTTQVAVVEATAIPQQTIELSPIPQQPLSNPTPNATPPPVDIPTVHIVQAGDTLSGIAVFYGVTVDAILAVNDALDPNILSIGQTIALPDVPDVFTPNFKIIADSRLVRAPGSAEFDIEDFISQQVGYISTASDTVELRIENGSTVPTLETASQVVNRVALEYSVDPRLLLAVLEFRAGWLSNPQPRPDLIERPIVSIGTAPNADGLYNQLSWVANELNRGYYGYKYRGLNAITFNDGTSALFNPELNPASIAVQYVLSLDGTPVSIWQSEVGLTGLYSVYARYFGDPFANAVEPIVPTNLQQPPLALPFETGVQWLYTGGPHGGWGSGSAWASLDFAPDEERVSGVFCYTAQSWLTAVAPGVIARAGDGAVVLDLDGDGDESTGWSIFYLHIASEGMAQEGIQVNTGDRIGNPSCAGGFSNATHVHIARRFNGEWLPADCHSCLPAYVVSPFTLGDWTTIGLEGQYYQGFMQNGTFQIQAEQGRQTTINRISG